MASSSEVNVQIDERTITRRRLLEAIMGFIGAVIAGVVGIPAIAYIVSPAFKKGVAEWIPIGSARKVEISVPTLFKTRIVHKQGWEKTVSNETMYALTDDGQHFVVMSNVCTHLGCRVHWDSEKQEFLCPCHGGVFDKQGNVVAGPPPRPLDRFQSKVENGKIFILEGEHS